MNLIFYDVYEKYFIERIKIYFSNSCILRINLMTYDHKTTLFLEEKKTSKSYYLSSILSNIFKYNFIIN